MGIATSGFEPAVYPAARLAVDLTSNDGRNQSRRRRKPPEQPLIEPDLEMQTPLAPPPSGLRLAPPATVGERVAAVRHELLVLQLRRANDDDDEPAEEPQEETPQAHLQRVRYGRTATNDLSTFTDLG